MLELFVFWQALFTNYKNLTRSQKITAIKKIQKSILTSVTEESQKIH